jgi:hypothetical protein
MSFNRPVKISVRCTMQEVRLNTHQIDNPDLSVVAVAADNLYFMGGKYTFRGGDKDDIGT